MPKKLDSVSLNSSCIDLIENYCALNDTTGAAFARKFRKNNRWLTDLRRGRSMILSSHEEAALMCQLLNTTPEEILMHEGKDEKETAKCQEDIKRVRELLEQAEQKESAPDPKIEGEKYTVEMWEKQAEQWSDEELNQAVWKLLKIQERRQKNGN